jgi:hypothetical protein
MSVSLNLIRPAILIALVDNDIYAADYMSTTPRRQSTNMETADSCF